MSINQINLSSTNKLIITKDINYRWIRFQIRNSTFKDNYFELGYLFDFKHNFEYVYIDSCTFIRNDG